MFKRLLTVCALLFFMSHATAQVSDWPSPEVEQMYDQAKDYLSKGGISQAIILFQQAIQLAPDVMVLHRDLAQSYNLQGNYTEAYQTVEPIINSNRADEQTYEIAAIALMGKGEHRKTKSILEKGIKIYSHSGLLYHQLGKYYEDRGDMEYALDSWLQGIEVDPAYHLNYYEAARTYATTDRLMWAVLYGEIFINMEQQTQRSMEVRKLLLNAYTGIFSKIGTGEVPKYGGYTSVENETTFEDAVMQTFMQLAPVVSDGITIDNLTMLRARFVMDWMTNYNSKFPFSLFTYQDKMLRDGVYEAYNQWLWGKTENANQFEAWKRFHPEAIPSFENWIRNNKFYTTAGDFYNNKELSKLFARKKKG